MRRTLVPWALASIAIYLISFVIAYAYREPAANLAYFVYPGNSTADRVMYVVFWPAYRLNRLVLSGMLHNLDRDPFIAKGP